MLERLMKCKYFDVISILLGVALLLCNLFTPCGFLYLNIICSAVSLVMFSLYAIYAVKLWCKRPMFDWHLLNGRFLSKVVVVVLLLPSVINFFMIIFDCPADYMFSKEDGQSELTSFWAIYSHYTDPGNQHMASPEVSGWAALVAILGIFLWNGLLVSSIIGAVDHRKCKWNNGEIRYKRCHLGRNKYAVVIGANEIAASVIRNLFVKRNPDEPNYKCEGDNEYVVLHTSRNPVAVRADLRSHLSDDELKRVIIYCGSRDSRKELESLYLDSATEIYVLGESTVIDGGETYHDAMNMCCVNLIAEILELSRETRQKQKIKKNSCSVRKVCKVLFEYQTTYSILQFSDISKDIKDNMVFIPFNRVESWARKVIIDNNAGDNVVAEGNVRQLIQYTPLDGIEGIKEDDNSHVHFVIVGMSNMGVAMGVQAISQAHYINFAGVDKIEDLDLKTSFRNARRTRVTFIDTKADKEMDFFKGRYDALFSLARNRYIDASAFVNEDSIDWLEDKWEDPMQSSTCQWKHLSKDGDNFIDVEIEFIKGEIESVGVRKYLQMISDTDSKFVKDSKLTIAICLTQTHQAVAASLYMPNCVYKKAQEIWVYQREAADIILNLYNTETKDRRYKKLRPFGMLYGEYMSDRILYLKALLVNGAYNLKNQNYDIAQRDLSKKETYADLRETWKKLSLDRKFSNKYYADSISLKLRSLGTPTSPDDRRDIIQRNEDVLARCEHNRWVVQQLLFGYMPCDSVVDEEFMTLNAACNTSEAAAVYNEWKQRVSWGAKSAMERLCLKNEDPDYQQLPQGIYKLRKEQYKHGRDRIHPNICDYDHLDKIESGAKDYDIYLNNAIPDILAIIEKYLGNQ